MQSKEEVVRNRKKLYPAPKSAISREAFRNAYMRLKAAERRLCQEQNADQSMLIGAAASVGHHFQSHGHHSGEDNSTGHEDGFQPMETEEVQRFIACSITPTSTTCLLSDLLSLCRMPLHLKLKSSKQRSVKRLQGCRKRRRKRRSSKD